MTPTTTWFYFMAKARNGTVLSITRRSDTPDGPNIQQLDHERGWVDNPDLFERFHDAAYYVAATEEAARAAAAESGANWTD